MARASASASAASSSSASDSLTKALFMVFIVPAAQPACGVRTHCPITYDQIMPSPPPSPTRSRSMRNRLLSPLVVAGALILLLEEWCWEIGLALVRHVAGWPLFKTIDRHIAA